MANRKKRAGNPNKNMIAALLWIIIFMGAGLLAVSTTLAALNSEQLKGSEWVCVGGMAGKFYYDTTTCKECMITGEAGNYTLRIYEPGEHMILEPIFTSELNCTRELLQRRAQ